ncbi:hypothetical protein HC031_05715 [Planosporangium thailandense]|uniref:Uncharacterized protein n=1 Tax=Planosporangium thailandense TaxID=765197 RepID=A0ABX0XTJ6_9ACTN|nr:hypothetical protein [Planosporangium thailandense]NJC69217.1 hypothetical protein [Planosporangium thailandense]
MNDVLDQVIAPGADLIERVDAALMAHGIPTDHPVTGLMRRVGALPADVLSAATGWRPTALRATASDLRRTAAGYERQRDLIAAPAPWEGAAGEEFAAHRAALVAFIGETGEPTEASLAGRLRATGDYLDDVAEWMERARRNLAHAVAEALGSAEAVALHAGGDALAAATIAARVLTAASEVYADGDDLTRRWAGRLDQIGYRPPATIAPSSGAIRLSG